MTGYRSFWVCRRAAVLCIGAGRHEEPRSKCALSDSLDPAMPEFRISPVKIPVCSIKGAAPSRGGVSVRDCPSSENGVEPSAYRAGDIFRFVIPTAKTAALPTASSPKYRLMQRPLTRKRAPIRRQSKISVKFAFPINCAPLKRLSQSAPESIQTLSKKRRKHKVKSEASQ